MWGSVVVVTMLHLPGNWFLVSAARAGQHATCTLTALSHPSSISFRLKADRSGWVGVDVDGVEAASLVRIGIDGKPVLDFQPVKRGNTLTGWRMGSRTFSPFQMKQVIERIGEQAAVAKKIIVEAGGKVAEIDAAGLPQAMLAAKDCIAKSAK